MSQLLCGMNVLHKGYTIFLEVLCGPLRWSMDFLSRIEFQYLRRTSCSHSLLDALGILLEPGLYMCSLSNCFPYYCSGIWGEKVYLLLNRYLKMGVNEKG